MIIFGNLLGGIAEVLYIVLNLVTLLVIARVIASWLSADPYNPLVRTVVSMTEPIYQYIRRYIPTTMGMFDLTPLIVLIIIAFIQRVVVQTLQDYSMELRPHQFSEIMEPNSQPHGVIPYTYLTTNGIMITS